MINPSSQQEMGSDGDPRGRSSDDTSLDRDMDVQAEERSRSRNWFIWPRRIFQSAAAVLRSIAQSAAAMLRPVAKDVAPMALWGLTAIAVPTIAAYAADKWFEDMQIEVGDLSATVGAPLGRMTTMAWTSPNGGPLAVGTTNGFLLNIRRDGTPVVAPGERRNQNYAPGPIVEIFPSGTDVTSEAVWASAGGGYAGYRLKAETAYRGIAYRLGNSSQAVSPGPIVESKELPFFIGIRFRSPVTSAAQRQTSSQSSVQSGPVRLTAVGSFEDQAGSYLVAGYESGHVAVMRAGSGTVLGSTETFGANEPAAHAGPVLAIAGRTAGSQSTVEFATSAADGSVVVYRSQVSPATEVEAQPVIFEAEGDDAPFAPSGPVPRRDGLMLDRSGRVLLLWDQNGGVSVARLDEQSTPQGAPIFRRYPLPGIVQSTPDRSPVAVQNALRDIGLYTGQPDGVMGPMTRAALRSFQARTGLATISADNADSLAPFLLPRTWSTSAVALSPRGDLFAVAGLDGKIQIVVLPSDPSALPSSAQTIALLGHHTLVTRIAISPDGRMLASLDATGRLLVTDLDRLLGISSVPLVDFSTLSSLTDLDPLPVDLGVFLDNAAEPEANETQTQAPDFLVVVDADRTLEAANLKASALRREGFENTSVLLRNGWYRTIVGFTDVASRDAALAKIRTTKSDAYPVFMGRWCPISTDRAGTRTCGASPPQQAS